VAAISMIFPRISLANFVQFKEYLGKLGPRRTKRYFVHSKIFRFHYCEYKQLKHSHGN